jgi:CheY-like chemotaxis protein
VLRSHQEVVVPRTKRLLIVEDNEIERQSIVELLGHGDIEIATARSGADALEHSRPVRSIVASSTCVCRT